MPSTLELCQQYFGTKDLYEILELTKDSLEKDVKKAYYKLSLKVHPDRVPEEEKELATEKFKVLAKIHLVLTESDKKALYDEKGIIDEEDDEGKLSSWLDLWSKIFKPLTTEDIDNYQKEYVGSEVEKTDIKKAYLNGKGCINYMMNSVPFMAVEDEPRIKIIVEEMIAANEVPEHKQFTNEAASKRNRRHKKYAREKVESEQIKAKLDTEKEASGSLEQQIMRRQNDRAENFNSFFDRLLDKYGDEDDTEDVFKTKKKATKKAAKKNPEAKPKERKVRNGKVSKKTG